MTEELEKALKDSLKAKSCTLGTRQVLATLEKSKLVVLSDSLNRGTAERLESAAREKNVPTIRFRGSSVALGRLCGLQFRVSTASFSKLADAGIKSLAKEAQTE